MINADLWPSEACNLTWISSQYDHISAVKCMRNGEPMSPAEKLSRAISLRKSQLTSIKSWWKLSGPLKRKKKKKTCAVGLAIP